jgi:hypothetical protein
MRKPGNPHERMERPDYNGGTPERHAPHDAVGTTKEGAEIHGTYQQPWVEHDPVAPDEPEKNIG